MSKQASWLPHMGELDAIRSLSDAHDSFSTLVADL